jgi:hypothetical protein
MLKVENGIIDNRNTKDTDNDKVKQSSRKNFLKDMTNNLWPTKLWRRVRILATMVDACLFQSAGRSKIAAPNCTCRKNCPIM